MNDDQIASSRPGNSSWLNVVLCDDRPSPKPSSLVAIPQTASQHGALVKIEALLESMLDAIHDRKELVIPYRSSRSPQLHQDDDRQAGVVRFPGRTAQEVTRFGRFCVSGASLSLAHVPATCSSGC